MFIQQYSFDNVTHFCLRSSRLNGEDVVNQFQMMVENRFIVSSQQSLMTSFHR